MDMPSADAALADLIAAGLVTHEMIGDPGRLAGEAAALHALCALVGGTVYRLGAFHYAFRAGPGDLGGRLGALPAGERTAALEAALQAELGADAVWLSAAGLPAVGAAGLDQPLLLLQARDAAVAEALAAAPAGVRAVVDARYAAETARITAAAAPGSELAARLAAIEARQSEILERLLARDMAEAAATRLTETLTGTLRRLEAIAARPADLEERLGLALAEFLARIEQRGAAPASAGLAG